MKRSLLVGLAALAALAITAMPAVAQTFKTSVSLKATYDTGSETVLITGKVTSPQALCEKKREVLVSAEPLEETFEEVKANGKGEFKWSFRTSEPERYKVQAFANTAKFERNGKINTCARATKLVPIG